MSLCSDWCKSINMYKLPLELQFIEYYQNLNSNFVMDVQGIVNHILGLNISYNNKVEFIK